MLSRRRRRTLTVHIGLPKTGSTSIQRMLWRYAGSLTDFGVRVALSGQSHGGHHHGLTREYGGDSIRQRWLGGWPDLLHEVRQHGTTMRCFVISSEFFCSSYAEKRCIPRIAEVAEAGDLEVEVVAYVRPQDQQMESEYAQHIRDGGTISFQALKSSVMNSGLYDYSKRFQPWRTAFGDRLKVYPLEHSRMPSGVLPHFLDILGAPGLAAAAATRPHVNRRMGAKCLAVMRRVNTALAQQMIDRAMRLQIERQLRRTLPAVLSDDAPFVGLDREQRRAVAARFADANSRLARECGGDAGDAYFSWDAIDRNVRPNIGSWSDLSDGERAVVARLVRNTAGIDLTRMLEPCGDPSPWRRWTPKQQVRTSESATPAADRQPARRQVTDLQYRIWDRRWLIAKHVLRRCSPDWMRRIAVRIRVLRYRCFVVRARLSGGLSWK